MTDTARRGWTLIAPTQSNKATTANDRFQDIEDALDAQDTIDLSAGNDTINATDWSGHAAFFLTGADTPGRTVNVPATEGLRDFIADPDNTDAVVIKCGTAEVTMNPGDGARVAASGAANVLRVVARGASAAIGAFTDLTDAPSDYTGAAGQFVRVDTAEGGVEFAAISLDDLPQSGAVHGDVITWDSVSGAWIADAAGGGGGGTPLWEWISETVPTVANAVTLTLPSGYDKFRIDMIGVQAASNVGLMLKLSQNAGSSYFDDTPDYSQHGIAQSADTVTGINFTSYSIFLTESVQNGTPINGVIEFTRGAAGIRAAGTARIQRYERATGAFASRDLSWEVTATTAACDRIKIMWASGGNFNVAGKVVLSGMTDR